MAELYSPTRVTEYGERNGLLSGVAFDLTTCDEDGSPWDFRLPQQRQKAAAKIQEMRPELLVGSPMCGPFSNLQNFNRKTPEAEAALREKEEEGEQHLEFCAEQYEAQMDRGGYFLHEHPSTARSWKRPCIERTAARDDVFLVKADLCRYGLMSKDEWGEGPSRKTTSFLTNSEEMANELSLRCTNDSQAIGVWKEYRRNVKRAGGRRTAGPLHFPVVRRVILDVKNMVVLQDLKDAQNAPKDLWRFEIPKRCKEVQMIFYYVKKGHTYHRHVPLTDGRAKQAQVYPEGLVRSIVQGLLRQLKKPVAYACGVTMGPVNQENDIDFKLFDETADADWDTFVDRGKPLKTALVEAARAEELTSQSGMVFGIWFLLRSVGTELEQHPLDRGGSTSTRAMRSRRLTDHDWSSSRSDTLVLKPFLRQHPHWRASDFYCHFSDQATRDGKSCSLTSGVPIGLQRSFDWCTSGYPQMFVALIFVACSTKRCMGVAMQLNVGKQKLQISLHQWALHLGLDHQFYLSIWFVTFELQSMVMTLLHWDRKPAFSG